MSGTTCCNSLISWTTTFSWSHSYSHSFLWDKCGLGKKEMKNPDGILFSMPRETESTVQKMLEVAETHPSGNREYTRKVVQNIKDRLRHDESISEISINSEKMHLSMWMRLMASSMQAALHMDPSSENNLELFKNSEFENIKGLFGIARKMIEGHSEFKNVFTADVAKFTLGKTCIAWRTSNKVYKGKSARLLGLRVMLGKTARSRRCNKKVEW